MNLHNVFTSCLMFITSSFSAAFANVIVCREYCPGQGRLVIVLASSLSAVNQRCMSTHEQQLIGVMRPIMMHVTLYRCPPSAHPHLSFAAAAAFSQSNLQYCNARPQSALCGDVLQSHCAEHSAAVAQQLHARTSIIRRWL